MNLCTNDLWKKSNYTIHETFRIEPIYEYDIRKANISILRSLGKITDDQYWYYYNLPKYAREVQIGLLLRDNPDINEALSGGFAHFRQQLFEYNDIQRDEVISIKKDAIFVDRQLMYTKVSNWVEFIEKNCYAMFLRLGYLELWFTYTPQGSGLDIKGIKDSLLETYESFIPVVIVSCLNRLVTGDTVGALNTCKEFIYRYVNYELPISAYREFNRDYSFSIRNSNYKTLIYNGDIRHLDISYNLMVLGQLRQILTHIYIG